MLVQKYFTRMKEVMKEIEESQLDAINEGAELIVESLINGGVWHVMDTGHMLMYEAIGRTGGLMAIRPVRVSLEVSNPTRYREEIVNKKRVFMDSITGLPEYIIEKSNMLPGDILFIGSVSGINVLPVEMAVYARKKGLKVIGLTSVKYSRFLESKHPEGKKLYQVCDVVLDNCAGVGDTLLEVEGLDRKICPSSGIAAAYIMWALQARVIELMLDKGKKPQVYISNHMPGASKMNAEAWNEYEKKGY
jgi:uncharacterized phosphosugar-binding protein